MSGQKLKKSTEVLPRAFTRAALFQWHLFIILLLHHFPHGYDLAICHCLHEIDAVGQF